MWGRLYDGVYVLEHHVDRERVASSLPALVGGFPLAPRVFSPQLFVSRRVQQMSPSEVRGCRA